MQGWPRPSPVHPDSLALNGMLIPSSKLHAELNAFQQKVTGSENRLGQKMLWHQQGCQFGQKCADAIFG